MTKTEIRFFTIADYEDEERWLREQHNRGLKLVRTVMPCFFIFEQCPPEDVVYRLDFRNYREGGDYIQLFRDYGWEYFNSCMGWLYFRKPASEIDTANDGEIFSDDVSRVDMIRHIMRTRMLPVLIIFLCCVLPNWSIAMAGGLGSFFAGVFSALLLVYLYLIIHCGLKLRKLKQKYSGE